MEFKLKVNNRNITDIELIEDIKRVARKLNKTRITIKEYNKWGKYSHTTITRRFGNWIKAHENSGLKATNLGGSHVSKIAIINDFKRIAKEEDIKTINTGVYKEFGEYNYSTVIRKFSNWSSALEAANLLPTGSHRIIHENELFEDILTLWTKLGRQPTTNDIKAGMSIFSLNTFCRRFGSWTKTLENFITYVNGEISQNNDSSVEENIEKEIIVRKTRRDINLRLRYKILYRDKFKCCICGDSPAINPNVVLHVDHIIPWSKCGETIESNLQTLCRTCNLGKSDIFY